jgi:hypothetical protein
MSITLCQGVYNTMCFLHMRNYMGGLLLCPNILIKQHLSVINIKLDRIMNNSKPYLIFLTRVMTVLLIILAVFLISIIKIQINFKHIGFTDEGSNYKTSFGYACLTNTKLYSCRQDFEITVAEANRPFIKRSAIKTVARLPKKTESTLMCSSNQQSLATYSYNKLWLSTLAKTNATADNQRQAALVSGESYQVFVSQLSGIFTSYNSQITQDYSNYISSLGSCTPVIKSPTLFQANSYI